MGRCMVGYIHGRLGGWCVGLLVGDGQKDGRMVGP